MGYCNTWNFHLNGHTGRKVKQSKYFTYLLYYIIPSRPAEMWIPGIINILRLKPNILIINPSQIPVISVTGLVKKPQRVGEGQFSINKHKYT